MDDIHVRCMAIFKQFKVNLMRTKMIHKTININKPLQNSHYTVNVCVTFHNQIMRIKHKYPALLYSDK